MRSLGPGDDTLIRLKIENAQERAGELVKLGQ